MDFLLFLEDEFAFVDVHSVHYVFPLAERLSSDFIVHFDHPLLDLVVRYLFKALVNLLPLVEVAVDILIGQSCEALTRSLRCLCFNLCLFLLDVLIDFLHQRNFVFLQL